MKVTKNDLFDYGLSIYQDEDAFKFSLDSILLAEFVEQKANIDCLVDFCTGNGAIPLILSTKMTNKIIGFEVQKGAYNLAYNSVSYNGLDQQIKIINSNLNEAMEYILPETVDIITCNPPYFKVNSDSYTNENQEKAIARHELTTNLEEIIMTSKYLLKNKGSLYLVHRPERFMEIIYILKHYKFSVKKVQFIYSNIHKPAIMILIKATKNGNEGLTINPPVDISSIKSYKNIFK